MFFFSLITLSFVVIQSTQRDQLFDSGVYDAYARSIVQDLDLNIINQFSDPEMSWMVTSTYNHPDFKSNGIVSYIWPFYLYKKIISQTSMDKLSSGSTLILANLFYILLSILMFFKLYQFYNLKHFWKSIFVVFFGSTIIWLFFFITTNSNIFGFAYSIMCLLLFNNKNINLKHFFVIGIAAGLGATIRIQLFWPSIFFILYLLTYKRISLKMFISFITGISIPFALLTVNTFLKQGQLGNPQSIFFDYEPISFFLVEHLKQSIYGFNGYFYLFPIYFVFTLGFIYSFSKSNLLIKKYHIIFLLSPLFILALTFFIWPNQTGLIGRDFISYSFIFIFLVSKSFEFITQKSIYSKILFNIFIAVCLLITWYHIFRYIYYDLYFWQSWILGNINFVFFQQNFFNFVYSQLIHNNFTDSFQATIEYLPFILLLSFILTFANKFATNLYRLKQIGITFVSLGIISYSLITVLNLFLNPINVKKLKRDNFFTDKVVATDNSAYVYDDFKEVYGLAIHYYLNKDSGCEEIIFLKKKVFTPYIQKVYSSIGYDPSKFKEGLKQGQHRISNIEMKGFVMELEEKVKDKCHFNLFNSLQ